VDGPDTTSLGELAADTMTQVAADFGDDCYIRTAAVIVEVDSGPATHFLVRSTDDRPWVTQALLNEAFDSIATLRDAMNREDDEDE
jgi:hypothetical protein